MQEAAPQTTDTITLKCPIPALAGLSAKALARCKIIIGPELSTVNTKESREDPKEKALWQWWSPFVKTWFSTHEPLVENHN